MTRFKYGVLVVLPGCVVGLLTNAIGILTLGYWVPSWDSNLMYRLGIRFIQRKVNSLAKSV